MSIYVILVMFMECGGLAAGCVNSVWKDSRERTETTGSATDLAVIRFVAEVVPRCQESFCVCVCVCVCEERERERE